MALRAAAWFARSRLENERARRLLDEAVAAARKANLRGRLVEVLVTRAAVTLELGHVSVAARDLDRIDELAIHHGAAELTFMRAVLHHNLGRLRPAASAYREVLAHPDATMDNRGSAATNLALIEAARGRFAESTRLLDFAAELARDVGPSLAAFVAQNRSLVLAQSGRLTESLHHYESAAALLAAAGIPLGELYTEHAETLVSLRLLPEASEIAHRAADELAMHGVALMAAEARLTVAQISLLAGDAGAAEGAAAAALAQFRRQRRPVWAARAAVVEAEAALLGGRVGPALLTRARRAAGILERAGLVTSAVGAHLVAGRLAEAVGRPHLARRSYRTAGATPRTGSVVVRLEVRLGAAHAERLAGNDAAVLGHCRAGLAELGRHRAALGSMELRALASGHGVELGRLGLRTLLRTGSPARVFAWLEQTRAAALLAVQPPSVDSVREELAELNAVHAELAAVRRESGLEPPALRNRLAAAEDRVRRATWRRSSAGGVAAAVPLAEVKATLDDAAMASFGADGDALFAVVVHRGRTRTVRLGPAEPVRFEVDALLFALRRLTQSAPHASVAASRASAEHAVARLAALLVEPLGIAGDVPLVIVPGGGMDRIPWSVLHGAPVSVAPSASVWARARARRVVPADGVVLVAGPGLAGAEAEIAAIAPLYECPTALDPSTATVAAVTAALDGAGLAHLACHGLLRADNPTFSALELTDGRLTVHELDLRGIAPRRVVLAACDSAADVAYAGDELLGFVSALLARGTAGVVASAVAVGDVEAVPLMRALHELIAAGDSLAVALHGARATIDLDDPRAFVNWCAFTAYGAG